MEYRNSIYKQFSILDDNFEGIQNSQDREFSLPDAEIVLHQNFYSEYESDQMFDGLYNSITWEQKDIILYGRKIALPRLTAWYGDRGATYTYSKIKMMPQPWIPILRNIKSQVERVCNTKFNSVLLNLYRNGSDSMAWHSDDEKELGENPTIASLSFGDTRSFMLKHKSQKDLKLNIQLTNGSLLIMGGKTQHYWQHQIPKTRTSHKPRINLTFRNILN